MLTKQMEGCRVVEIKGKDVQVSCLGCTNSKWRKQEIYGDSQYILYLYATSLCNAHCNFCSEKNYNRVEKKFESKKLAEDLRELKEKDLLNKISITGGEPFLYVEKLNEIVNTVFDTIPDANVSITTNGSFLDRIYQLEKLEKLSSIHVSRHHYSQEINDAIFGVSTATGQKLYDLNKYLKEGVLSLNCCLVKDNIDDYDDMMNYINVMNDQTGIDKIGFINLMGDSEYCRENRVDFSKIIYKIMSSEDSRVVNRYFHNTYCDCMTWLQKTESGGVVEAYWWEILESNSVVGKQFIYNTDNHLQVNFNPIQDLG